MLPVSGFFLLLVAIVTYKAGALLTQRITLLSEYNIPAPVTGGLLASLVFTLSEAYLELHIDWDLGLRDQLLLIFFSTVGLNARTRLLISGGKTLPLLFGVIALFLVLQNSVGIASSWLLGEPPIYGLLAGSISMAGGHGTAISWGSFLESNGYPGSTEFGLMAATMGLIMGGLLGGPVARRLIQRHKLKTNAPILKESQPLSTGSREIPICRQQIMKTLGTLGFCIATGCFINGYFREWGVVMPDYLPVLILSIVTINLADLVQYKFNEPFINLVGDISLELFISMSLMSLDLIHLAATALPVFILVAVQSVTTCLFAYWVLFRAAGNDYDAGLITAGFVGLGLGATPVGLANVNTLAHRLGASPKALLIVPLLGSVFTDTLNAVVVQAFLLLPLFH